ncbi:MAG TPA: hypothetical protein VI411_02160 [Actinomycetota bacterium]
MEGGRWSQQCDEQANNHDPPRDWTETGKCQARKGDDTCDGTEDIEPVGVKGRKSRESNGDAVSDGCHRRGGCKEDEGQHHPGRQPVLLDTEVHQLAPGPIDRYREGHDKSSERSQEDGSPSEEIRRLLGAKESDPDAQEAAEKDEIGEVRKVDDVRARPTDQNEFREKHQEAREEQLYPGPSHNRDRLRP